GAGTSELAAAAGYHNGLFYNFAAPDFTVIGAKVLFAGQDATGNPNLWVTDGTSAGTKELAVAGANSGGLFSLNFFPSGFSPGFTVLGTRALFEGYDASGVDGLWVTDGTSAGTRELAVAGANSGGLFDLNFFSSGFSPGFTVLGTMALFEGYDANGVDGLWVTDGTSAGTRELSVSGGYANGLFAKVSAPDITVIGGTALFAGKDASGKINLWVTDGTSAGTSELTAAGASSRGLSPNDFVGLPTSAGGPSGDFNGDGQSDL